MKYKFTQKELDKALKKLTIIVDTREQSNYHIIDFLNAHKHPYKIETLEFGDYSCMLPAGSFEGQSRAIYFSNDFVIERKSGIDEIAMNLKNDGARLKKELAHLNMRNIKFYVYVEDPNFEKNLRLGSGKGYRSRYDAKALSSHIYSIEADYDTVFIGYSKDIIGSRIYNYMLRNVSSLFKRKGFIIDDSEEITE